MTFDASARAHLLAFADDEHMIGARHTSWIGLGPFLEEDLAFCSIAQDELGHAIALYEILVDADAGVDSAGLDAFAMLRAAGDYRSCWLAEIECTDWNDSLVRHWLYDRAEALRWGALVECPDQRVAALAHRALREESFHLAHAERFMARIAGIEPTGRIADSIARLVPIARGMWDTAIEGDPADTGFTARPMSALAVDWELLIAGDLERWGVRSVVPSGSVVGSQRQREVRSAGFDGFLGDLQRVLTLDTSAVW